MATRGTVHAEERRASLLERLDRTGAVTLDEAAEELGVSVMTVRRDLDALEAEGRVRRVRGGAVAALGPAPFRERRQIHASAKQVIAAKAVALVPDAGAICLDASTTAGSLGALVAERAALTIVTNAWDNFESIRRAGGATAVLAGGTRDELTGSFVGPIANQAASAMMYERFFTSATAINASHGSSEVSLAEAEVKRSFASRAREVIMCLDSSKLGQASVATGFGLAEISTLVTELDPDNAHLDDYRAHVRIL